jgi:hypothetical protein
MKVGAFSECERAHKPPELAGNGLIHRIDRVSEVRDG